jgi:orotidine-5'-phosphate decarboxylase
MRSGAMQKLTPPERLIVAADFKPIAPNGCEWVKSQVLDLAGSLAGTGVYLKVNSALRACGYDLIGEIQSRGLRVFADLKLFDIGETLSTDGVLLREFKPELLTTVCVAGVSAMQALKAELPNTEVLGVTVLTSLKDADTQAMFTCTTEEAVMRFAQVAAEAKIDGLISSPMEAEMLRERFGVVLSLNTPAIRPAWAIVPGDDQNPDRIMTPAKAIKAGANRIVVGRPITKASNPYDAVMRTIDEIAAAED